MSKVHTLKSGTELPLMNLKGKQYLQVAHRLVWLVEEVESYSIHTEFLKLEDTFAVARTVVEIFGKGGEVIRTASATKKETQKDFPDFIEKAETGSLGRALAMLGFGSQFAEPDMEEGQRLADSPMPAPTSALATLPGKTKTFKQTSEPKQPQSDGWDD